MNGEMHLLFNLILWFYQLPTEWLNKHWPEFSSTTIPNSLHPIFILIFHPFIALVFRNFSISFYAENSCFSILPKTYQLTVNNFGEVPTKKTEQNQFFCKNAFNKCETEICWIKFENKLKYFQCNDIYLIYFWANISHTAWWIKELTIQ